ncbi:MAG TPA: hypothetical protein VI861_01805 [Rickettsiales bacterium]|nr:hypothetical protein [Rickettsiales bacterium]
MLNLGEYSGFVMVAYIINDLTMSIFAAYFLYQYFAIKKKFDAK